MTPVVTPALWVTPDPQVTSPEEVGAALAVAQKKFGRLDLAVNCAGVGIAVKTYNSKKDKVHDLGDFQRVINVSRGLGQRGG